MDAIRCLDCGVEEWVNPVDDHEAWVGHPWNPSPHPMTADDWLSWVRVSLP